MLQRGQGLATTHRYESRNADLITLPPLNANLRRSAHFTRSKEAGRRGSLAASTAGLPREMRGFAYHSTAKFAGAQPRRGRTRPGVPGSQVCSLLAHSSGRCWQANEEKKK